MKLLMTILGTICVALGVIGIFLPLMPTTPFLLLAAALYCRSSDKMYAWLLNHKYLGAYIRNFREHKAIPMRIKIIATSLMAAMILYCIFFVVDTLWLKILLGVIMAGVGYHILSYKTLTKEMADEIRRNGEEKTSRAKKR